MDYANVPELACLERAAVQDNGAWWQVPILWDGPERLSVKFIVRNTGALPRHQNGRTQNEAFAQAHPPQQASFVNQISQANCRLLRVQFQAE